MSDPHWDVGIELDVPARPSHGNWTRVVEYVDGSQRLKFDVDDTRNSPPAAAPAADGAPVAPLPPVAANAPEAIQVAREPNTWSYAQDKSCGADGDSKAPINPSNCLMADAPPGALIAKIGGSTAGKISDGVKSFVVGSFCVIDVDDKSKGTLYLTMNADPMAPSQRTGFLRVKIYRSG